MTWKHAAMLLKRSWKGVNRVANAMRRLPRRLFFLHMPKTGGTSVHHALHEAYCRLSLGGQQPYVHLDPEAASNAATVRSDEAVREPFQYCSGEKIREQREALLAYFMAHGGYRYISGHFPFSQNVLAELGKSYFLTTCLRSPVKRFISHYSYTRYKQSSHFSHDMSIDAYLDSPIGRKSGCLYVRMLQGIHSPASPHTEEALKRAKDNLDMFDLVGFVESMDNYGEELSRALGVRVKIQRLNTNPAPKAFREEKLTDEHRDRIRKLCQPDMRLYRYAADSLGEEG